MADLPMIKQLTFWHSGARQWLWEARAKWHTPRAAWGRHFKEGKQIYGLRTVI